MITRELPRKTDPSVLHDPLTIYWDPPFIDWLPDGVMFLETQTGCRFLADLCTPVYDRLREEYAHLHY